MRIRTGLAITALLLAAFPGIAQQQPPPAELVDALMMKVQVLQQNLDHLYLSIAKQQAAAEAAERNAKWVLDNWVK